MELYQELADEEWLRLQYESGLSSVQIAEIVGCTPGAVQYRMRKFGIKARGRWSDTWKPKQCEGCGVEYIPSGPSQRYCTWECRAPKITCVQCGEPFAGTAPQSKKGAVYQRKYCSHECRNAWRRENCEYRYVNQGGYVVVPNPTMHRAVKDGGYVRLSIGAVEEGDRGRVLEHRWVMEQRLGRRLFDHERVHHINGDRTDNRIENLELWSVSQPPGQRVEDKIAWAKEILRIYGEAPAD